MSGLNILIPNGTAMFAMCLLEKKTWKVILGVFLKIFQVSRVCQLNTNKASKKCFITTKKSWFGEAALSSGEGREEHLCSVSRSGTGLVSSGCKKSLLKEVLNFNESSS